ncbi:MAG: hypothetical protein GY839_20475 [candidate division Zixibacteria bacterium]|nr:hypothetical protein [candidate division Zixibacteria bacterium]
MRRAMAIITICFLSAGLAWSGQLDGDLSITEYFASNQIVAKEFFNAENVVDDIKEPPLSGDIYEFDAKSTKKAFFYSMLVPGAGQYYAGSRIKPFVYLAAEAIIWSGYFSFKNKGNDQRTRYQDYADQHYVWEDFMGWWDGLSQAQQDSFSHRLPWDDYNNQVIKDHEYYENIGKYDQFQIGWFDIPIEAYPPPYGDSVYFEGTSREIYVQMRKKANDYFQNANTMIMLSLGNRIISAFEAALTAKKFNKGKKRFAFRIKTKKFGEAEVPMLTWNYTF